MRNINIIKLIPLVCFVFYFAASQAAPGDILFQEEFDNNGDFNSDWSASGSGSSGVSAHTFNSPGNSLFINGGNRTVTSKDNRIDANVSSAEVSIWIRRGDDSFSEDPDTGEDLEFQYLNASDNWITLDTYPGNGTPGEIFTPTFSLPADALHDNLRLRLVLLSGNSGGFDYWHVDDIVITETGPPAPPVLVGEWQFEELLWNGVSNEVVDSSGNDLHLTAYSAATSNVDPAISGTPGTCSYGVFNGSISFIQRDDGNNSLLDIPDTLTVTTWINTNVIPSSGLKSILSKDENYEFHIDSSGQIYWWWSWATLTTTGAPLTTGQWHHIAVTWRSGEQLIYIDGVERARSSRTGTLNTNNDPLQVGQDLDISERFFDGYIDEVRIYNGVLSEAEVNQVMNETHPCTIAGACTKFYIDKFNQSSYSNSDGLDPWTGNWIESGDDGSASSGDVYIAGGDLTMGNQTNHGDRPSLVREADLSGAISAVLKVELDTSDNLENGDRFEIEVSPDGGTNWSSLQVFSNDVDNTYTYDLTAFASVNTQVRLSIDNGYSSSDETIDIDNLSIFVVRNCGPDHFAISHDGSGINCLREAITIRAEDSAGSLVSDYGGTVDLSLITNHGNWFVVDSSGSSSDTAQGTLTDTAGDNNGAATYQFDPADSGSVVLYLEDKVAETTNINVSSNLVSDDNSEGNITFRPIGFTFSPDPITTQIAGRPFDITLTAAGQTPSQPECGVIEEYDGVKALNFWSSYTSPLTSPTQVTVDSIDIGTSEASSTPQNVTFTNGVATVTTQYDDVGQISIHAKDDVGIGAPPSGSGDEIDNDPSDPLVGGITPFVVRPFAYDIQVNGNPNATDGDAPVFAVTDETFKMTLRSVLWESSDDADNDGIPDDYSLLVDNGVTPNIRTIGDLPGNPRTIQLSPLAMVVTNNNGGLLKNSFDLSDFPLPDDINAGVLKNFDQSWNEVGILQINATTSDFMGSGEAVIGQRVNIGRFIPHHFNLSITDNFEAQCNSFSYSGFANGIVGLNKNGQQDDLVITIQAEASSGSPTRNYYDVFAKLESGTITISGYDVTNLQAAPGSLNNAAIPDYTFDTNGRVSGVTIPDIHYQFNSSVAPFDLRIDLIATDSDGVTSGTLESNLVEMRLGRMRLLDSYGPELADLEMRLASEYFDGNSWLLNTADSCSTYVETNLASDLSFSNILGPLDSAHILPFSPNIPQAVTNGRSLIGNGLWFRAPGEGFYGSTQVNLNLNLQDWLRFDWDGDNTVDPNASATLNFGYYRGSDRVIYWREVR